MIAAEHLSKLYGSRQALTDVSFAISRGEVVGFLGLNGAGKTTVLKILAGILWPSAGRVRVEGFDSLEQPRAVRQRAGFLPDAPPLYGDMTVRAMLRYTALLNGLAQDRVEARLDQVIETCQLREVQHDLVAWLSHGYRKRVGIAQTIAHEPALVILDEPTAGLDPEQIVAMRPLIRRLAEKHTVLISSHILSEIERTCDRILVLHEGRIVAQGAEHELFGPASVATVALTVRGVAETVRAAASHVHGVSEIDVGETAAGLVQLKVRLESDDAREALVKTLVEAGLGVRRVAEAQGGRLESVFLQLTRGASAKVAA